MLRRPEARDDSLQLREQGGLGHIGTVEEACAVVEPERAGGAQPRFYLEVTFD